MKTLIFATTLLVCGEAVADEDSRRGDGGERSECPHVLTERYVVGVWQGSISHTFPPEAYMQHSRITFHSDGTFNEHHEYFQPSVPTFPTSVLITTSQGYWKINDRGQLVTDIYVDSEFGPDAGSQAGLFFSVARLRWSGDLDRTTCKVAGPWSGSIYFDYESQVPVAQGAGQIMYKKIAPSW
jgi:hypothetical protein